MDIFNVLCYNRSTDQNHAKGEAMQPTENHVPLSLSEDTRRSCGDVSSGNLLIHGDNLAALEALQHDYAGRIQCIYCDPPYNINAANGQYADSVDNSVWLAQMKQCLSLLAPLLTENGVILVQIDKEQSAYLKVLMDEIFSRSAYVTTIAVRMSATSGFKLGHSDKTIVKNTEYIHVYSRDLRVSPAYEEAEYDPHYCAVLKPSGKGRYRISRLLEEPEVIAAFEDCRIPVKTENLTKLYRISDAFRDYVFANRERIGRVHSAPAGAEKERDVLCSLLDDTSEVIERTYAGETYYIKRTQTGFNQFIPIFLKFRMVDTIGGYSLKLSNILGDWWDGFYLDMGNVDHEGEVYFKNSKKPERLLFRILNMFTQPGEYVLDPFLGSGTTAAAAHKMRRRWIGIESGEHACTLCKPRLDRIIGGTDSTGITRFTDWQGGSGYQFCEVSSGG